MRHVPVVTDQMEVVGSVMVNDKSSVSSGHDYAHKATVMDQTFVPNNILDTIRTQETFPIAINTRD